MPKPRTRRQIIADQRSARYGDTNLDYVTIRDMQGRKLDPETGQPIPEGEDPGREAILRKLNGESKPKADAPRVRR